MTLTSILFFVAMLFFIWVIVAVFIHIKNRQKEEALSDILIFGGIELILGSFGTFDDKLFAFLSGTQSNTNYIQLGVGFILLIGGIFFLFYVKNKLYILNINGYFDKRIEQHHHEIGLNAFQFKEREIDFIRMFNKGLNPDTVQDIQEEIKGKIAAFKSESKDKRRAYTGIAPIPFIFMAGKEFSREKVDKYFEYNKFTQTYYELTQSKKRCKPPFLKPVVELSTLPSSSTEDVALVISITQNIKDEDLTQFSFPIVRLALINPKDNAIKHLDQLHDYTKIVYQMLLDIKNHFPQTKRIHVVYSGQSCLPFEVGKLLDDQRITEVISYHYQAQNTPPYAWGLVINGQRKGMYQLSQQETAGGVNNV